MPDALHGPCTFSGAAAEVRVRGVGEAVLVEPGPFAGAKVRLIGAQIGDSGRTIRIEGAEGFEPVKMNRPGQAFDVTYEGGATVVVAVATGAQNGKFKGKLEGAPGCVERWCDVVWSKDAKRIELDNGGKATELVGKLPMGGGALQAIAVRGVKEPGEFACRDGSRRITGDWEWKAGPLGSLTLEGIRAEGGRLHVRVTDEGLPVQAGVEAAGTPGPGGGEGGSRALLIEVGVAGAVIVAGGVVAFVLLRRRRSGNDSRTRAVRVLLGEVLRTDADLDAFCLDFFPEVHRRFTDKMDRVTKVNLLLTLIEPVQVEERLRGEQRSRARA